ncbi:MAG: trypsin-like peptidase domain-containing protein [Umezawaea sp.]
MTETRQDFPAMSGSLNDEAKAPGFWRRTSTKLTAAAFAAAVVAGTAGGLIGAASVPAAVNASVTSSPVAKTSASSSTEDVSAIASSVLPSVVQVNVAAAQGSGIGSGVVLSADGKILTNNHVISGAQQISVTTNDGKEYAATVVGADPNSDLAVLKLTGANGLTAATFGDSSTVAVGDQVVAIGSPEGLQGTVTTGIVSALDRTVNIAGETRRSAGTSYQAIQTDASINPGNSGGPLLNSAGQVIGINSAIYSPSTGAEQAGSVGIGFSIPSNQAMQIANQLMASAN